MNQFLDNLNHNQANVLLKVEESDYHSYNDKTNSIQLKN